MGIIYFIIILGASVIGAIVGLGGGVIIRPIFDSIGYHGVLNISFFSSTAIFTMAIVSTVKKLRDGSKIDFRIALLTSVGAIFGGSFGNLILEYLVSIFTQERYAQIAQITITIVVLAISIFLTIKVNIRHEIKNRWVCLPIGVLLGTTATFLGIGGGPINVPIFMILFGLPIKEATTYSIVVIFFSHLSRLVTMGFTVGYSYFDLPMLLFVIPAAAIGGLVGAKFSKIFSETTVKRLFIAALTGVILLNIYNGFFVV